MSRRSVIICLYLFPLMGGGCWSGVGIVNYAAYNAYTEAPPPQYQYDEKGRVVADGWSSYVASCDDAAESALEDALESAKALGANGLAHVKWTTGGGEYETPHCEGSFWIYWWGCWADVSASAILIRGPSARLPGVFPFDPDKPASVEARRLLAIMRNSDLQND